MMTSKEGRRHWAICDRANKKLTCNKRNFFPYSKNYVCCKTITDHPIKLRNSLLRNPYALMH